MWLDGHDVQVGVVAPDHIVDDAGQPIGIITQYHMFETLVIEENDSVITSGIRNEVLNDIGMK